MVGGEKDFGPQAVGDLERDALTSVDRWKWIREERSFGNHSCGHHCDHHSHFVREQTRDLSYFEIISDC